MCNYVHLSTYLELFNINEKSFAKFDGEPPTKTYVIDPKNDSFPPWQIDNCKYFLACSSVTLSLNIQDHAQFSSNCFVM